MDNRRLPKLGTPAVGTIASTLSDRRPVWGGTVGRSGFSNGACMLHAISRSDPSADGRPIGGCAARQARGPSADGSDPSVDRWLEHSKYCISTT